MIPLEIIHKQVAKYFRVSPDQIFLPTRRAEIVYMRQIFHFFAKKYNPIKSLETIGKYQGHNYDHATIVHSIKKINGYLDVDQPTRLIVEAIDQKLVKRISAQTKSLAAQKHELIDKIKRSRSSAELYNIINRNSNHHHQ